jgi:hypothetical protein
VNGSVAGTLERCVTPDPPAPDRALAFGGRNPSLEWPSAPEPDDPDVVPVEGALGGVAGDDPPPLLEPLA